MAVEIELNGPGIVELLQSAEMQDTVREAAEMVAANVGDGFEVGTAIGHDRCRAFVVAATPEARKACYSDNLLLKAIGI